MKKLILTGAMLTSITLVTRAQDQSAPTPPPQPAARQAPPPRAMPTPENMAERRAKGMQTQLGLNDEQYKSCYNAELEFAKVMIQARTPSSPTTPPDRNAMHATMQKANEDKDAKYKAFLTPDQWTKYDAMRPKMPPPAPQAPPAQNK